MIKKFALMQLPFCFTSRAETKWSNHINVGAPLTHSGFLQIFRRHCITDLILKVALSTRILYL